MEFLLFFSLLSSIILLLTFPYICNSKEEYLKLPLLHKTPFSSPSQALSFDTHRLSLLHSQHHNHVSFKSPIISGASSGSGQYFVDLRLGTPPQSLLLVADTGSDLVWVKCSACRNCTNHNPSSSFSSFFPRHSTTFSPHHCYDKLCRLVPRPKHNLCNRTILHSPCRYEYSYADGSVTTGFFSKETTTLRTNSGSDARLNKISFGCGFKNAGASVSDSGFKGLKGVIGLGRGPISFSSQLGRRFGNKFSYCLMDYTISPPPTSYLRIGGSSNDVVSGTRRMSYTPLESNPLSPTFYYIRIQSVSVGGLKLPINPSVWSIDQFGNGGTVIDSGTTLTFLAEPAYRLILAAFRRRVKLSIHAELSLGFDLCVNVSSEPRPSFPKLSFTLVGRSVLSPPPRNYFIDVADRVKCLAIQPINSRAGFAVIGNLMQQGYLFEFDNDKSRLGFSRRACALQ